MGGARCGRVGGVLIVKMSENLVDNVLVFNTAVRRIDEDPDRSAATTTDRDRAAFGSMEKTRFSGASHDAGPRSLPRGAQQMKLLPYRVGDSHLCLALPA